MFHFHTFSFTLILFIYTLIDLCNASSSSKIRVVFPYDFVSFSCLKSTNDTTRSRYSTCSWTFLTEEADYINVTNECTTRKNLKSSDHIYSVYKGYVEIPEKATSILCDTETGTALASSNTLKLEVQDVRLADPIRRQTNSSTPSIILQRFSNDYGVRLASHDVTNEIVKINGDEVDGLNLICIHSKPVVWKKFTESRRRVLDKMNTRHKSWVLLKPKELENGWNEYLTFLMDSEGNAGESAARMLSEDGMYATSLIIRNVTSMTSRTYECHAANPAVHEASNVSVIIEDPRTIGPDEIEMIEQIIGILESQGKGQGKEPWAALGSITSIILVIFLYYLRMKYNSRLENQVLPTSNNAGQEETELRTRLRQNSYAQTDQEQEPPPAVQIQNQRAGTAVTENL